MRKPPPPFSPGLDDESREPGDDGIFTRGVMIALLLASPFWIGVTLTAYWLLR
jgi:hypothetical protein